MLEPLPRGMARFIGDAQLLSQLQNSGSSDDQTAKRASSCCQAMGGRTHAGLAQQMPQTGQGLGEPQPEGPRLPAPRLNQTHGQKALQDIEMFPDRLLDISL